MSESKIERTRAIAEAGIDIYAILPTEVRRQLQLEQDRVQQRASAGTDLHVTCSR